MNPNLYLLRRFVDPRAADLADYVELVERGALTVETAFPAKDVAAAALTFLRELRRSGIHREEEQAILECTKKVIDAARGAVELSRMDCHATRH